MSIDRLRDPVESVHSHGITCSTQVDTELLAKGFAGCAEPGDVFLLSGLIGTGKSVFARALIQKLLEPFDPGAEIPSPTYTIVQTYHAGQVRIWHADLYRLKDTSELNELGFDEAFEADICLIEWPELLGTRAPACATRIHFQHINDKPESRLVKIDPGREEICTALFAGALLQ